YHMAVCLQRDCNLEELCSLAVPLDISAALVSPLRSPWGLPVSLRLAVTQTCSKSCREDSVRAFVWCCSSARKMRIRSACVKPRLVRLIVCSTCCRRCPTRHQCGLLQ